MDDHALIIMIKTCLLNLIFTKVVEFATPDLNVMEWFEPSPFCWVYHGTCSNGLNWHLHNIMGKGLTISVVKKEENKDWPYSQGHRKYSNPCSLLFREFTFTLPPYNYPLKFACLQKKQSAPNKKGEKTSLFKTDVSTDSVVGLTLNSQYPFSTTVLKQKGGSLCLLWANFSWTWVLYLAHHGQVCSNFS